MDLRQIDALVAEKVMGFKVVDDPLVSLNGVRYIHKIEVAWDHGEGFTGKGRQWPERIGTLPRYSSEIAAAWQVVERLIALGYRLDIRWLLSNQWDVIFEKWPDPRRISKADPSCALAICLAALRAVGVEVTEDA